MRTWSVDLLVRATGEGLDVWNDRIRRAGFSDEAELRGWLRDRGVEGYAQGLLVWETFGYPDFLTASAEELIDGQYADRPALRPILDAIVAVAPGLGEVTVQARKGFVTLVSPRRQFAMIRATTRTRVDLGLRIDGERPHGRLEQAKRLGNDTINVRIPLTSVQDVDTEVVTWLQRAYDANA